MQSVSRVFCRRFYAQDGIVLRKGNSCFRNPGSQRWHIYPRKVRRCGGRRDKLSEMLSRRTNPTAARWVVASLETTIVKVTESANGVEAAEY